jgi:hypothetical protein
MIDSAVDQYAIETNRVTGFVLNVGDWTAYLKSGTVLYNTGKDLLGNTYGGQTVDSLPKVPPNSFAGLSDVAPAEFWSPYPTN